MRARMKDLIAALDGRFEDHHGEEARIILGHIDALNRDIARLEDLATAQIARIPASWGVDPDGATGPGPGKAPAPRPCPPSPGWTRSPTSAPPPRGHHRGDRPRQEHRPVPGQGRPLAQGPLGEAAAAAARPDTWLGERYRRLARRRGKRKALVATARAILVIIFHLLSDPTARYRDLGPGYYDDKISAERKIRNLVRQLEALGLTVTITPAEDAA
jgi:transposase